jgi:hypothetical protein
MVEQQKTRIVGKLATGVRRSFVRRDNTIEKKAVKKRNYTWGHHILD